VLSFRQQVFGVFWEMSNRETPVRTQKNPAEKAGFKAENGESDA